MSGIDFLSIILSGLVSAGIAVPSIIYSRRQLAVAEDANKKSNEQSIYLASGEYRSTLDMLANDFDHISRGINKISVTAFEDLGRCFLHLECAKNIAGIVDHADGLNDYFCRSARSVRDVLNADEYRYGDVVAGRIWVENVIIIGKDYQLNEETVEDILALEKYCDRAEYGTLFHRAHGVMSKVSSGYVEYNEKITSSIYIAKKALEKEEREGIQVDNRVLIGIRNYLRVFESLKNLHSHLLDGLYAKNGYIYPNLSMMYQFALIILLVGDYYGMKFVAEGKGSISQYYRKRIELTSM